MIHRLSHSTMDILHTCERKFQLERLLVGERKRDQNSHTVFGTAYGIGCAHYLVNQNIDEAIFQTWLAYYPVLEDDKKDCKKCINLVIASQHKLDNLLQEWEVVSFQDRPAIELSFRINIDDTFYYVGYIDAVLRNRFSGIHAVLDCKHTGSNLTNLKPMYQNSSQCVGYSIILDQVVGQDLASYSTLYFVGQLDKSGYKPTIHVFDFNKSLQDRLNWFITLGMDIGHIHEMLNLNVFPMRGSSCLRFNRPCPHFDTCQLHNFDEYKTIEEDNIEYQFVYDMDSVIQNHINRIGEII